MINDVNIASKTNKPKYKDDEDLIHTNQKLAPWQQCKLAFVWLSSLALSHRLLPNT